MSAALRQAVARLGSKLGQQKRLAGNLPAKPNKFVEEGATRRENIEREFKWDGRTLTNIALFAGVVPYVIYSFTTKEFDHADEDAGRPKRAMWGSP